MPVPSPAAIEEVVPSAGTPPPSSVYSVPRRVISQFGRDPHRPLKTFNAWNALLSAAPIQNEPRVEVGTEEAVTKPDNLVWWDKPCISRAAAAEESPLRQRRDSVNGKKRVGSSRRHQFRNTHRRPG